jgi:hypothetical protein
MEGSMKIRAFPDNPSGYFMTLQRWKVQWKAENFLTIHVVTNSSRSTLLHRTDYELKG